MAAAERTLEPGKHRRVVGEAALPARRRDMVGEHVERHHDRRDQVGRQLEFAVAHLVEHGFIMMGEGLQQLMAERARAALDRVDRPEDRVDRLVVATVAQGAKCDSIIARPSSHSWKKIA
jgi:hypothetical protein